MSAKSDLLQRRLQVASSQGFAFCLPPQLSFLSFSHRAVRMQLFRHIFLTTFDLPDSFSFSHYFRCVR
jgi:hypothetical protein